MNELERMQMQLEAANIKIKQKDRTIVKQEIKIKELQGKIDTYEREIIKATSEEEKLRIFEKQFHSVNWNRKNGFL